MTGNTRCTSYHVSSKIFVPMTGNTSCTSYHVPFKRFVPMTGNNSCTFYHPIVLGNKVSIKILGLFFI